jgi:hypothetical protein
MTVGVSLARRTACVVLLAILALAAPAEASRYTEAMWPDWPLWYWRLGDPPEWSHAGDWMQGVGSTGGYGSQVVRGRPGALEGDPDTSADFLGGAADGVWGSHVRIDWDGTHTWRPGRAPFSLEIWVRPRALHPTSRRIWSREGPQGGYLVAARSSGLVFSRYTLGPRWPYHDRDGGTTTWRPAATRWHTVTAPLARGRWSHVVATYDGEAMRLWVDGRLVGSRASTVELYDEHTNRPRPEDARRGEADDPLVIGAKSGRWLEWDGGLDEAAFYKYALPAERVAAHHEAGT